MSNYMNEEGEPLMTAAEIRFEAELDRQSAEERYYDDYYDGSDYEPDPDECCAIGDYDGTGTGWVCHYCGSPIPTDVQFDAEGWPIPEDAAMEDGLFGSDV